MLKRRNLVAVWCTALLLAACADDAPHSSAGGGSPGCAGGDPSCESPAVCEDHEACPATEHCSSGACAPDVCSAGTRRCNAAASAVQQCSDAGDAIVERPCADGCRQEGDTATCGEWLCMPSVGACAADGVHLETCSDDGLELDSVDCSETDQACVAGACVDRVCEPDQVSCDPDGNALEVCSSDGTSLIVTPCGAEQYCDVAAETCLARVCTPSAESCRDGRPAVCDELGAGYVELDNCAVDQACVDGQCAPIVCIPDTELCGADGNAYACDETGTVTKLIARCEGSGENEGAGGEGGFDGVDLRKHCELSSGEAACHADPCRKNRAFCSDNQLQLCNPTGTGPVDAGTDCGASARCVTHDDAAECAPLICEPNKRFCSVDGDVHGCSSDGTSWYVWDECELAQRCDAESALCLNGKCSPGAPVCNGALATTCKANGSGFVAGGTDCSLTNKVCDNGQCKPNLCEPNQYSCVDGNPQRCNATGSALTPSATCSAAQHCLPGYWYCLPDVCDAGEPYCASDTHLSSCASDGHGAVNAGVACGAGSICEDGQCKLQVCSPYTAFCSAGNVQQCAGDGKSSSELDACTTDEYCRTESPTWAICTKRICDSGTKGCVGEAYGTCKPNGSGYTDAVVQCPATGKICGPAGCATSVIDECGDDQVWCYMFSSTMPGNIIRAGTNRKLTLAEFAIPSFTGLDVATTTFHWAVYVSEEELGPYVALTDFSSSVVAAEWQPSGALGIQLEAGKYYFIGVNTSGGSHYVSCAGHTHRSPLFLGEQVSSHTLQIVGGVFPTRFALNQLYDGGFTNLRLTTTAP